jgi:hypothetical protein
MANMQSEVFEAFRSIDIPEEKALKAAGALAKRDDDVIAMKSDMLLLKWMIGFVLAFQAASIGSAFAVWLKIGDISAQVAALATRIH